MLFLMLVGFELGGLDEVGLVVLEGLGGFGDAVVGRVERGGVDERGRLDLALLDEIGSLEEVLMVLGMEDEGLEGGIVLLVEGVRFLDDEAIEEDFPGVGVVFILLIGELDAFNEEVAVIALLLDALGAFDDKVAVLAVPVDLAEIIEEKLAVLTLLLEGVVNTCEEDILVLDVDLEVDVVLETLHPPMIDGTAFTPVLIGTILVPQLVAWARRMLALS